MVSGWIICNGVLSIQPNFEAKTFSIQPTRFPIFINIPVPFYTIHSTGFLFSLGQTVPCLAGETTTSDAIVACWSKYSNIFSNSSWADRTGVGCRWGSIFIIYPQPICLLNLPCFVLYILYHPYHPQMHPYSSSISISKKTFHGSWLNSPLGGSSHLVVNNPELRISLSGSSHKCVLIPVF